MPEQLQHYQDALALGVEIDMAATMNEAMQAVADESFGGRVAPFTEAVLAVDAFAPVITAQVVAAGGEVGMAALFDMVTALDVAITGRVRIDVALHAISQLLVHPAGLDVTSRGTFIPAGLRLLEVD
jgi:hypothetical protein